MSRLMTKTAFAALCQITHPMLAPHKYGPYLVMRGKKVDARQSLNALEGRLDEQKRRDALAELDRLDGKPPRAEASEPPAVQTASSVDNKTGEGAGGEPDEPVGWKARHDMIRAKSAEVAYKEQLGALTPVAEIEQAMEIIVAAFWTETERSVKIQAAELASELSLDADQAAALKRKMEKNVRTMRDSFTRACRRLEAEFASAGEAAA